MCEALARNNTKERKYMNKLILPEALKAYGIAGLWHEVSGKTERNTFHSCVAHDGQLVFDPHKSNAGLTTTTDYGVFVALNPAKAKTCKAQN